MLDGASVWKVVCAVVGTAVAVVGCVAPAVAFRGQRGGGRAWGVLRALAGGVIVATALMHTLPEGRAQLESGGLLGGEDAVANATAALANGTAEAGDGHDDHAHGYPYGSLFALVGVFVTYVVEQEAHGASGGTAASTAALLGSLVVHSVLVGVSLGTSDAVGPARGLSIALIVHQLCEGLALGVPFRQLAPTWVHFGAYVAVYALSLPVGIGVGVLALLGEPTSRGASIARGVLSTLASGVLLYVGVAEFLAGECCEASHCGGTGGDGVREPGGDTGASGEADAKGAASAKGAAGVGLWWRLAAYVAAAVGGGVMAVLAIWS